MRKILVCAYSCVSESGVSQIGGEAELGFAIVGQLARFFQVFVLTHQNNQKAIEIALQKNPLPNVRFFYLSLPKFLSFLEKWHRGGIQVYSYLWQIRAYFLAQSLHQKNHFDAFHHVTYANDWMASFIGALLPVPYLRGPGGGAHAVPSVFLTEYTLKQKVAEKVRSFGQWLFRHDPFFILGQNRARVILVCNQEAFEALPKKWQVKTQFFPVNGIYAHDISTSVMKPKKSADKFLVLTAGKLLKIKSVDLAIKAFYRFSLKNPDATFLIVGDGPEAPVLEALTKNLGLNSVVFQKWLPRHTLLELMAQCDVFLFTSLRDGGGAVVVEAMSQAKPVICFDMAGPGFHIQSDWGVKIKPENPNQAIEDIANALEKLYSDKNWRKQLGLSAQKRAQDFYDWNILGEKLYAIYQNIFSEKK